MTPRSPWRDGRLNVCFGEELPALLRHHRYRDQPVHRRWRPIGNDGAMNKPTGGLFSAPVISPPGKWRPFPKRSTWTEFCSGEMPERINGRFQTVLYPRRDAVFAVIDSAADARALYDAFPNDHHPTAALLRQHDHDTGFLRLMIDWPRVLDRQIAGVYLTDRGQMETRLPDESIVPSLYGWDVATVWFTRPDGFTLGETRPSPWIDPDPYGMGWGVDGPTRLDLGKAAAELQEMNEALRRAMDAAHAEDADALEKALTDLRELPEAAHPGNLVSQAIETFEELLRWWAENPDE